MSTNYSLHNIKSFQLPVNEDETILYVPGFVRQGIASSPSLPLLLKPAVWEMRGSALMGGQDQIEALLVLQV